MPTMVVSSSALRFSGRASRRTAIVPRCSAASEGGNLGANPLSEAFLEVVGINGPGRFLPKSCGVAPGRSSGLQHLVNLQMHRLMGPAAPGNRQDAVEPRCRRVGG